MKKHLLFIALFFSVYSNAQTTHWLWARNGVNGGSVGAEGTYMTSDNFGNAFLTGSCGDTLSFGAYTLTSNSSEIFLVKYDMNGNVMWARKATNSPGCISSSAGITTDAAGNIFMTGFFTTASISFDSFTLTNSGMQDIFIVKFDSSGNTLWAKAIGGSAMESGEGVTTDAIGNCYITGYYRSPSLTFDTHTISNLGSHNIFIAKYDTNGNALWATSAGGNGVDIAQAITSDASNNIYITGSTASTTVYFGTDSVFNITGYHFFISKYNSAGAEQWVRNSKGDATGSGVSITSDVAGDIISTGNFSPNTLVFGTDSVTYTASIPTFTNAFVVKYNSSGNEIWATTGIGQSYCIISDNSNNTFISGTMPGTISTFDTLTLQLAGTLHDPMYVVKLNQSGNATFGIVLQSGGDDINGIAKGPANSLYVGGDYFFVNPFILGNDSLPLTGAEDAFVARLGFSTGLAPTADYSSSLTALCQNSCINFTNLSQNATSYQWLFPGGTPSTDTTTNPQGICYSNSGVFDVTLIATNNNGTDTMTLHNFLTVYPGVQFSPLTQNGDTLFSTSGYISYQWYEGSNVIAGANTFYYVATHNGNYSVVVSDSNGCNATAQMLNVIASVKDILSANNDFTVYYSAGNLYINKNSSDDLLSDIFLNDNIGKEIYHKNINLENRENVIALPTMNLSAGIYFIKIVNSKQVMTVKIYIE